jgi:hypothetical protein
MKIVWVDLDVDNNALLTLAVDAIQDHIVKYILQNKLHNGYLLNPDSIYNVDGPGKPRERKLINPADYLSGGVIKNIRNNKSRKNSRNRKNSRINKTY